MILLVYQVVLQTVCRLGSNVTAYVRTSEVGELLTLDNVKSCSSNRYSENCGFQELFPQFFRPFADFHVMILLVYQAVLQTYIYFSAIYLCMLKEKQLCSALLCVGLQLCSLWIIDRTLTVPTLRGMLNISYSAFFCCKNCRLLQSMMTSKIIFRIK